MTFTSADHALEYTENLEINDDDTFTMQNPSEWERGELWQYVDLESEAVMLERLLKASGLGQEWEDIYGHGRVA